MEKKQVFNNAKWIIVCKVAQAILQLIIGAISARYFGPSNYGIITYAASIVAFALPIMRLGFDAILVYELIAQPEKEGEIMGSSIFFNVVSGFACILGVSVFVSLMNMGDRETITVCVLYSISIIFSALEMIQYWFQYKLLSKYSSIIMLIAYFVTSLYKILLLALKQNIYWFVISYALEYMMVGVLLLVAYHKKGGGRLSVSLARAKSMLHKSRHYILSEMMVVIFHNTDHIMLTAMVGPAENGFYSAAVTTASIAQFVFVAIIDSFRPLILLNKKEKSSEYKPNISRLYGIIIYLALLQSLVFTVFAPIIIKILYGVAYSPAVAVLQILTWYRAFSFIGSIRNIWLLAEEKQKILPAINLTGVIINCTMNAILIPHWGACGAAFASFLTQFLMNFVLGFVLKDVRENNKLLLRGVSPVFFVKEIKGIVRELLSKE